MESTNSVGNPNWQQGTGGSPSTRFSKDNQPSPETRERKGSVTWWLKEFGEASRIEMNLVITKNGKETRSEVIIEPGDQLTINQAVAVKGLEKALRGKFPFWKEVLNRQEGRTALQVNLGGVPDNPVRVVLEIPDKGRRTIPIDQAFQPTNVPITNANQEQGLESTLR